MVALEFIDAVSYANKPRKRSQKIRPSCLPQSATNHERKDKTKHSQRVNKAEDAVPVKQLSSRVAVESRSAVEVSGPSGTTEHRRT